jgi:hypothetical protein
VGVPQLQDDDRGEDGCRFGGADPAKLVHPCRGIGCRSRCCATAEAPDDRCSKSPARDESVGLSISGIPSF